MGRGRASVGGASRPAHSAGTGVPRTPPTSGKCRHTQGSQTHSVFLVKVFNDPFNTHRGYNEVHTLSNIPPGQSSAAALVWESSPFQLEEGSPTALHSGSLKREACRAPGRVVNNEWKTTIKAFEKGIHMGIDRRVHIYPERAVRSPAPMQMFSHP
eukprot:gene769-412_t